MTDDATERRVLILGTHHFAPEVLDLASEVPGVSVDGFVENLDRSRTESPIEGLPVHWIDDAAVFASSHLALCALGTTARRSFVEQAAGLGFRFVTLTHPTARVSTRSTLGDGTIVSSGAMIGTRTAIGRHVIVNRGALIGHDVVVGDYVTIAPGANVAGLCRIGDGAYVAMSAVVLDRITVGAGALVGAGAVVTRDVPPHTEVLGLPARVVKEGVDGR
jgi:sugar O-acyltransferase (sialic acid O-acetyltransferase NeuD family)